MDNLYNQIKKLLKDHHFFIPYSIEEDLIHECIGCMLEIKNKEQAEQIKCILSCANHFLYENRKYKKLVMFDEKVQNYEYFVTNNIENTQHTYNSNHVNNDVICKNHLRSIKDLVSSKGDYTLVEIASFLQITRFHLYKSIKNNKLGLKSRLRLNKIPNYNKKEITNKLINIMIKEKIIYNKLGISRSSWYYGIHNGFSYSQIYKMALILKQQFNIKGIIYDIY